MIEFVKNILNPMFYNILYMSIIGIIVGIFILVFRKLLDKNISPKWKCMMWGLLLFTLIIPFKFEIKTNNKNMETLSISGLVSPIQNVYIDDESSFYKESIESSEIINELKVESEMNNQSEPINKDKTEIDGKDFIIHIILPLIWSIGVLISIILMIKGNMNIKNKINKKTCNEEELENILKECKEILNIKKNIKIVLQNFKKTPSIIGIIKPRILITEDLYDYMWRKE